MQTIATGRLEEGAAGDFVVAGAATLVAANGKLYGFWYRPEDKMGSPWNAVREGGLAGADLGKCRAVLYPSS
ncbi:MAG TPA: hypothetical protein PK217_09775 [Sphingopyxis terrae]|nr:hypothetical protein [Sphingopyxis terrae]HRE35340.1 hypothetical protein [Sphingopyxis terrae]